MSVSCSCLIFANFLSIPIFWYQPLCILYKKPSTVNDTISNRSLSILDKIAVFYQVHVWLMTKADEYLNLSYEDGSYEEEAYHNDKINKKIIVRNYKR